MKWLDTPPVWLVAAILAAWAVGRIVPGPDLPVLRIAGGVLLAAGVVAMLLAVLEFRRARTTIVPRQQPDALITGGIYRHSRNPIYLADTLILLGLILIWSALPALVLVPLFMWVISVRFIRGEEAVLAAAFPQAFPAYVARTRRWI